MSTEDMPFLGISFDCARELMLITNEKRVFYVEDILELVSEDELEFESKCVASDDLNSVVHK